MIEREVGEFDRNVNRPKTCRAIYFLQVVYRLTFMSFYRAVLEHRLVGPVPRRVKSSDGLTAWVANFLGRRFSAKDFLKFEPVNFSKMEVLSRRPLFIFLCLSSNEELAQEGKLPEFGA